MGGVQGKTLEVGSRKLQIKSQLKSDKSRSLFLVKDVNSGQDFVLKRTIISKGLNDVLARAKWEAELYQKIQKHKNLLACYGLKRSLNKGGDAENLLILEFCSGGSLKQSLQRRGSSFTVPQAISCLRNMCSCLGFLHGQKTPLIHLGVRLDNIFLHANGQWKLGDFGCCALSPVQCAGADSLKRFERLMQVPRAYRAPEILDIRNSRVVDVKADVWALGCVFYATLYQHLPFSGDDKDAILRGSCPIPDSPAYEKPVVDLLRQMLCVDPQKRISISDLRQQVHVLHRTYCSTMLGRSSSATPEWIDAGLSRRWGHTDTSFNRASMSPNSVAGASSVPPVLPSPQRRHGSLSDVSEWATKATNPDLLPPKAKYIRRLVILSWERHDTGSLPLPGIFEVLAHQPVLAQSSVAFKVLQTIHKLVQEGAPSFIDESLQSRSLLLSICEHWSTHSDWLSSCIVAYAGALEQRLLLLRDAFVLEGNFALARYLSYARLNNFTDVRADVWLTRCCNMLISAFDHAQDLVNVGMLSLGTSGVAPSKTHLAFRETVLVLIFDDLFALFDVCTFLLGIVKETQPLHSYNVASLEKAFDAFFVRFSSLVTRAADSALVRALRRPPQLPTSVPVVGLQAPYYPVASNVPGLASRNVEFCEELRSFFQLKLEAIGIVVLPFELATNPSSKLKPIKESGVQGGGDEFVAMFTASRAGTAPLQRVDKNDKSDSSDNSDNSDVDFQRTLREFISSFDTPSVTNAAPIHNRATRTPAATSTPQSKHGLQISVSAANETPHPQPSPPAPLQNMTTMKTTTMTTTETKPSGTAATNTTRHRPQSSMGSSSPSSVVSKRRSRTWSRGRTRRSSRTPSRVQWHDNATDVLVEWASTDVDIAGDAAPGTPSASSARFAEAVPPLELPPANARQKRWEAGKRSSSLAPARSISAAAAVAAATGASSTDATFIDGRAQTLRPRTAGYSTANRSPPMLRRRPRTADFKASPFDHLVLAEQRQSSPVLLVSTNRNLRANAADNDLVDDSELDNLDIKVCDDGDDDNPFAVIEKSIKAAQSQHEMSDRRVDDVESATKDLAQIQEDKLLQKRGDADVTVIGLSKDDSNAQILFDATAPITADVSEAVRDMLSHKSSMRPNSQTVDEVDLDELVFGDRIGVGGFAEVYKGEWRGTEVAIKKLLQQKQSDESLAEFRREVDILRRLRHPNIVMFMGACTKPPNLSLVTELLQMSLFDLLHNTNVKLSWKIKFKIAIETATGMNFLHMSKPTIIHRDLKSANLLLDRHYGVKVSDFGLSRVKAQHYTMTGQCGTFQWMAPEVIASERYTEKADVYSFGVILWELVARKVPFEGMNGVQVSVAVATRDFRPTIPPKTPEGIAEIIQDCWTTEPVERPVFTEIVSRLKHLRKEMLGV